MGGSETESAKVPVNSFSAHLVICVITSHILGIIKVSEAVEFMVPLSNNSSRPLHSCHDLCRMNNVCALNPASRFPTWLNVPVTPEDVMWKKVCLPGGTDKFGVN